VTSVPADRLRAALADRYRVERLLGQGGMATVHLAHDLRHERKVAIKVLRPELAAVIGAERFVREIRTIAALQHPHILGLIDSGEVQGTAYYVMPFVEGESLRDRLTREKQLPVADAVRIATEAASALDYAHRHGVIHRDIKPENILLHDGRALVADFGIALAVSQAGETRMTETGMSLGRRSGNGWSEPVPFTRDVKAGAEWLPDGHHVYLVDTAARYIYRADAVDGSPVARFIPDSLTDVSGGASAADSRRVYRGVTHPSFGYGIWYQPFKPGPGRLVLRLDDPALEFGQGMAASATDLYFVLARRESDLWTASLNLR
jgi:serine/threonine protein kinase